MTTLLLTHPRCLAHDPGPDHPEQPSRLRAIMEAFNSPSFASLKFGLARAATLDDLSLVHTSLYLARLDAAIPPRGLWNLDVDTIICSESKDAALYAVGAVCDAIDAVLQGDVKNAFCAVRPPGHHADANNSAGFCLFNNIAIGAMHARRRGLRRIAIVDFDVHHGNGTQSIFWNETEVLFASIHQWPFDTLTGALTECGAYGNCLNLPLEAGSGSFEFRESITLNLLPRLLNFEPELILVSAGFDAHWADPLASINLIEDDFLWLSQLLTGVAEICCRGMLVAALEGGYSLPTLASCVTAYVEGMFGELRTDNLPRGEDLGNEYR